MGGVVYIIGRTYFSDKAHSSYAPRIFSSKVVEYPQFPLKSFDSLFRYNPYSTTFHTKTQHLKPNISIQTLILITSNSLSNPIPYAFHTDINKFNQYNNLLHPINNTIIN